MQFQLCLVHLPQKDLFCSDFHIYHWSYCAILHFLHFLLRDPRTGPDGTVSGLEVVGSPLSTMPEGSWWQDGERIYLEEAHLLCFRTLSETSYQKPFVDLTKVLLVNHPAVTLHQHPFIF